MLNSPIEPDQSITIMFESLAYSLDVTFSIDVCPANNNLVASAGADKDIKLYDRREARIVRKIKTSHSGIIKL